MFLRKSNCRQLHDTEKIRLTISSSRGEANICNVGLYYAENISGQSAEFRLSDVKPDKWSIVGLEPSAGKMIDGDKDSCWKTDSLTPIVVNLGHNHEISGFVYTPPVSDDLSGTIFKYDFYVSSDGITWEQCVANGEFSNIMHNPIPYYVRFGKKIKASYIKLVPLREINSQNKTSVGEIGILL